MAYHLLSQLAHIEVTSPKPEETEAFLTDVLGLQVSHREGQSVWLRAWAEYFHHSLKLTEGTHPGLAHVAYRVDGPDDLALAAKALNDQGAEGEWTDGDTGHGEAYRFRTPGGHLYELFWEVDWHKATPEQTSVFPNRPQKQVAINAAVRRLDHVTLQTKDLAGDKRVLTNALGLRHMESTLNPAGDEIFITLTSGASNHDLGVIREPREYKGPGGRYNHFCYFYDTREEVLRAADILSESGYKLEHGPHKHGMGEPLFMYVFEPGGNRIELQSGGYWNYIPDWEPIAWRLEQGSNIAWQVGQFPVPGSPQPDTAHIQGTLEDLLGPGAGGGELVGSQG